MQSHILFLNKPPGMKGGREAEEEKEGLAGCGRFSLNLALLSQPHLLTTMRFLRQTCWYETTSPEPSWLRERKVYVTETGHPRITNL